MTAQAAQHGGADSSRDSRRASADAAGEADPAHAAALPPAPDALDTLVGYNCRRAYLAVIEHSMKHLSEHALRPASFSVLSLVHHEPGLNSRQIAKTLGVHPPNLVPIIGALEARKLIERRPDPSDARSLGLHPTVDGRRLAVRLERQLAQAERQATSMLSDDERQTLIALLARIWAPKRP
ncbi:MAG: MarR family transcriptional regulator [Burkholderiaceae bacterium]|nr:MarR family transcriptional regulator [Burkholderiaceae bacterium]